MRGGGIALNSIKAHSVSTLQLVTVTVLCHLQELQPLLVVLVEMVNGHHELALHVALVTVTTAEGKQGTCISTTVASTTFDVTAIAIL